MIKYSIIIPVKEVSEYIRETIPKLLMAKREDLEILVYPDEVTDEVWPQARQIPSGPIGPAQKRNLALRDARGEVLVFIDDDAYPKNDFFDHLDLDFRDSHTVAVGGPALTPKESKFWQKVSGAMFLSPLSGGFPERYRSIGRKRMVFDWPTVNLSIRKKIFADLGGFSCEYWPGEDTYLGFQLLIQKNCGILYDPELIVYHHRREGLLKHVQQISAYGLHRGFFVKKFTRTSLNWRYFMPSAFVLFVVSGAIASLSSRSLFLIYIFGWSVYFVALLNAFYDIWKHERNFLVTIAASYYIFLTHIFYGINFLRGLFTRDLKSKLR